jgi:hypothetical protein
VGVLFLFAHLNEIVFIFPRIRYCTAQLLENLLPTSLHNVHHNGTCWLHVHATYSPLWRSYPCIYGGHCQDLERVNDILLSLSRGSEVAVIVQYSTSPSCSAVQWLEPAQTAGKQHPYLFTQCQVRAPRSCNKVGNGAEGKDS